MKKTKNTENNLKEHAEEVSYKPNEFVLWKQIFHLPSEPVWYMTLIVLNYVNALYHLYTSIGGICVIAVFHFYTGKHYKITINLLKGVSVCKICCISCFSFVLIIHQYTIK